MRVVSNTRFTASFTIIAASFSHHDRVAVQRLHERIDLVRYRIFDGGLLSLLLIESTPGSPRPAPARQPRREREEAVRAGGGSGGPPVQASSTVAPACLQDLYVELDEALTVWGEVEVAPLRHYIANQRMVNIASVIFRPKHEVILVYLRLDPDMVEPEEGFAAAVPWAVEEPVRRSQGFCAPHTHSRMAPPSRGFFAHRSRRL
ncbi:hypothetical protein [Streptomyces sp. NPDC001933]|uniref:hypothetical protein n=1 Tax=Streptomyces sp. NPDC001933 TaxID=3364626 RepID=UPI00367F4297